MNTSPAGLNLIKQSEGLRLVPYNDAVGNATVGYGHLLHRGPLKTPWRRQPFGNQASRRRRGTMSTNTPMIVSG